jgi:hypothetical protein
MERDALDAGPGGGRLEAASVALRCISGFPFVEANTGSVSAE